ncbi:MAG: glycoside hydrolase family 1 protein [Candidatus Omnitrophica bacterium]|nr:glycoside hydrolase family 1 protein [Candidatus Omnitrophota bacterium]
MRRITALVLVFFVVLGQGCAGTQKTIREKVPQEFTFPQNFLWGAGTSSHQVEGNNTHNDWWQWEQHIPAAMRSGVACDEWNRFESDFLLAQKLGLTAYRFSLEWSRIEPFPGQFDQAALDHYRQMILSLKTKGMEPIITLNHFTIPLWLANQGGWLADNSPELFARYTQIAIEALGGDVKYWITLNEPAVYAYKGYMTGQWPPGEKSNQKAFQVVRNLAKAHVMAYEKIKKIYVLKGWKHPMVGIAQQVVLFEPCSGFSMWDRLSARVRSQVINHLFVEALIKGKVKVLGLFKVRLPRARTLDFIGLNYYTREYVRSRGFLLPDILGNECLIKNLQGQRNGLGWEIYPQGLYTFLKEFSRYKLPLLISENGICTNDDTQRAEFITAHLRATAQAMKEGVSVFGYLYWSLMDNYEWAEGFSPRFGLIEVNYATQERTIRPSAQKYSDIIRSGKVSFKE